jgi:hypothetical protein
MQGREIDKVKVNKKEREKQRISLNFVKVNNKWKEGSSVPII